MSEGPGEASGWNWTPLNGFERCRIPSLVPSLALENQGSQSAGRVLLVHRVAVVLGRDETALGPPQDTRLVLTPMAVPELVRFRPSRQGKDLVAQANPEDGGLPLPAAGDASSTVAAHILGSPGPLEMITP